VGLLLTAVQEIVIVVRTTADNYKRNYTCWGCSGRPM